MPNKVIPVDLRWRDTIINCKEVGSLAVHVLVGNFVTVEGRSNVVKTTKNRFYANDQ